MPNASTPAPRATAARRPGWPEIIVGLLVLAIIGFLAGAGIARLGISPASKGLIFAALSGIAGLAGFGAALSLRIRSWSEFGVRRVTKRWLWIGAGAGLIAFFVKVGLLIGLAKLIGPTENVQEVYAVGASGGFWSAILATLFLSILTPLGEEFLFRGVVTNALLRYGPVIGVVGSAVVFALFHGWNMVFPAALVAGLAAGEVFRRSGSVWPGIVLHAVFNAATIPVMMLASEWK